MTDPMTPERLAEIEARANAATEGPWEADGTEITQHWTRPQPWVTVASNEVACMAYCYGGSGRGIERETDAEFIAHARTDVPALLVEVRRLQAAVERVRALHQDEGPSQGFFPGDRGYGKRDHCCGTCGEYGEYGVEWPCPTVTALDGDEQ